MMWAFASHVARGLANDPATLLSPARLYISSGRTSPTRRCQWTWVDQVPSDRVQTVVVSEESLRRCDVANRRVDGPAVVEEPRTRK